MPGFMSWQGSVLNVAILVWSARNLQIAQLVLRAFILLGELASLAAVDAYPVIVRGIASTVKKIIIWTSTMIVYHVLILVLLATPALTVCRV